MQSPRDNHQISEKPLIPKCPHCGAGKRPGEQGAPMSMTNLVMGPMLCVVFFCGNPDCGAIFSVNVLEMALPGHPQAPKPLLHIPGGG